MFSFSLSANTHTFTLDNGLVVVLKEIPSELVSVKVAVRTGSQDEGEQLGKGLSHYLEHLLFKGTKHRTADAIDLEIETAGGSHNAYTSWEHTVYHVTGVRKGVKTYLDVLSDMVFHSTLAPELMEKEREVVLEEMKMYNDEPWDVLGRSVLWASFKKTPLRFPIIGFEQNFKALTRDELWAYYKQRYVPNNMVLLIAGGVGQDEARQLAKQYFGQVPRGTDVERVDATELPVFQPRILRLEGPQEQVHGLVEYAVPYLNSPYNAALKALTMALGTGESSLLWRRLREEKQLVISIGASYSRLGERGLIEISYLCDEDKVEAVEAAIYELLGEVRERGISQELLDRVKCQSKVSMLRALMKVEGQASRLLENYLVQGDLAFSERYYERLTNLTQEDVSAVAREFLQPWNAFRATMRQGDRRIPLDRAPEALPVEYGNEASEAEKERILKLFKERLVPEDADNLGKMESALVGNQDEAKYPLFERVEAENGIEIYLQNKDALPLVSLVLTFRGGVLVEPEDKRGLTSLLGTVLRRARPEVVARMEALGGHMSNHQGGHALAFSFNVLKENFAEAADLLSQVLQWPEGDELEIVFNKEKQSLLDSIKHSLDDSGTKALWEVRRIGFGNYPYRDPAWGRLKTVNNIELSDLRDLWQALFVGGNAQIAIAGQFDPEEVLEGLKPILAALPSGMVEVVDPAFTPVAVVESRLTLPGREQAFLCQAYPIPGENCNTKERYTQQVLLQMMGTMGSPLFKSLRNKGLVYSAGAATLSGWGNALWSFYAGSQPSSDNERQVYEAFDHEIERLKAGKIEEAELERAKLGQLLTHVSTQENMGSRAGIASWLALMGLGVNAWAEYIEHIRSITLADLANFATNYFQEDKRIRVVVEPGGEVAGGGGDALNQDTQGSEAIKRQFFQPSFNRGGVAWGGAK